MKRTEALSHSEEKVGDTVNYGELLHPLIAEGEGQLRRFEALASFFVEEFFHNTFEFC